MREQRCKGCGYIHLVVDQIPLRPILSCPQCPDLRRNPKVDEVQPVPRPGLQDGPEEAA